MGDLKKMYEDVHRKIRSNPSAAPKKERDLKRMKLFPARPKKLTAEDRRQRLLEGLHSWQRRMMKRMLLLQVWRLMMKRMNDLNDDDVCCNIKLNCGVIFDFLLHFASMVL